MSGGTVSSKAVVARADSIARSHQPAGVAYQPCVNMFARIFTVTVGREPRGGRVTVRTRAYACTVSGASPLSPRFACLRSATTPACTLIRTRRRHATDHLYNRRSRRAYFRSRGGEGGTAKTNRPWGTRFASSCHEYFACDSELSMSGAFVSRPATASLRSAKVNGPMQFL
ncbi:hypothetical protein L226DRAFT_122635 [Lentinus tigrinus ALCF2SS1-7]|uniref:Uncharacterized protein n=1 Tax=Lentinus tigrinus ALCF2SS1-6 TaxID=1328759 RepID=A0A5C2SU32_9APHY|nr:hypothetical protein L227DRAFT_8645 [Lentinus tigrinus ALCF2SS1-6]RPD80863.1 hypothetical protein L226DRAFT_122635 [Lentinus tigrinus ALCF2SS1-7]